MSFTLEQLAQLRSHAKEVFYSTAGAGGFKPCPKRVEFYIRDGYRDERLAGMPADFILGFYYLCPSFERRHFMRTTGEHAVMFRDTYEAACDYVRHAAQVLAQQCVASLIVHEAESLRPTWKT